MKSRRWDAGSGGAIIVRLRNALATHLPSPSDLDIRLRYSAPHKPLTVN